MKSILFLLVLMIVCFTCNVIFASDPTTIDIPVTAIVETGCSGGVCVVTPPACTLPETCSPAKSSAGERRQPVRKVLKALNNVRPRIVACRRC